MSSKMGSLVPFVLFVLFVMNTLAAVAAQTPSITVNSVWRPASQLTTIDANSDGITDPGDDLRFVIADIYATTNVEFWAVGFTCTVNRNALESYVQDGDPNGLEDNVPMFAEGVDWSTVARQSVDTTDTDGKLNFAVSVLGEFNPPMGSNGVTETLHIASIKYRVKEGLTSASTSPLTCTTNFLNRDGRRILNATYTAPTPLNIIPGYTLKGSVAYQGTTTVPAAVQRIDVLCDDSDGDANFDDVVTTANATTGVFNANNLRTQGRYDCQFVGNILSAGGAPDLHLLGITDFNLVTTSFALLPVTLRSGNVDNTTAGSTTDIDNSDISRVTSNWNAPPAVLTSPYLLGDATGDRKINEADLAIVASNFNRAEPVPAHHLIYSLPRDVNVFQNSHLWLGEANNQTVKPFVIGTTRDYWPALSPDGALIAFIRNVGTNGNDKFALFTAPINNGVVGTVKRLTPASANFDAFAPAWSPDGSQIAFVCSYDRAWVEPSDIPGHLCLIDRSGLNFRRPANVNGGKPIFTKMQPPAWVSSQFIYVAYPTEPGEATVCDESLCLLNLTNYFLTHPAVIPAGSDFPVLRETVMGRTLFYRFNNGAGSRNIRFAQISPTNALPFSSYPTTTAGAIHEDVETGVFPGGGAISIVVDYFTVSTGADPDIWLYASNPAADFVGGNIFITRNFTGTSTAPNWAAVFITNYTVSDAVSNPAFDSGYNAALRNTAAFVP